MARSPSRQDDNPSYAKLKHDLGDDTALLHYLPYKRVTFQRQNELEPAASDRILYGDMVDEKDQLWIYFTIHHKVQQMISFYTLKGAQQGRLPIRPARIQDVALASSPFKHARDHFEIMAIAKYFFVRRGIDDTLKYPLSVTPFKDDLLSACRHYREMYTQSQAAKKAAPKTATKEEADASVSHTTRASSQTTSIEGSRKRARSSEPHYDHQPEPGRLSPYAQSPTPHQRPPARMSSDERDAMLDQYIDFQVQDEELNDKISDIEKERSEIAARMAELQENLKVIDEQMWVLVEEKRNVRSEKEFLQNSLTLDEQLEFGFEAGRKMESKRLKRE